MAPSVSADPLLPLSEFSAHATRLREASMRAKHRERRARPARVRGGDQEAVLGGSAARSRSVEAQLGTVEEVSSRRITYSMPSACCFPGRLVDGTTPGWSNEMWLQTGAGASQGVCARTWRSRELRAARPRDDALQPD